MGGSAYWTKEVKKADARSPKEGAIKRVDRLHGVLRRLDPVVADRAWRDVGNLLQQTTDRHSVRGSAYWTKEIREADARSAKEGAIKRLDRLRGVLRDPDPVIANRAWRDVRDALQRITDRYSR
ncbi:hypothetical protein [Streptomyces sp. BK340]|uniref:hypothetical protein n=1 Tax=Streptomyces sp. BK340 TaxID=2572903 RepID=UPI0011A46D22|nr:hypothetical protein [Streptomyces sp. BK340]TVZ90468.1 hypothetical protein FB157_111126 [Streptomyces sp. BK340]